MANRGCTITVSLLDSDGATMTLPVALHSPLSVLKDQLATITSISVQEQVLILCDLTDKDRNNDRLLQGKNSFSFSSFPSCVYVCVNVCVVYVCHSVEHMSCQMKLC